MQFQSISFICVILSAVVGTGCGVKGSDSTLAGEELRVSAPNADLGVAGRLVDPELPADANREDESLAEVGSAEVVNTGVVDANAGVGGTNADVVNASAGAESANAGVVSANAGTVSANPGVEVLEVGQHYSSVQAWQKRLAFRSNLSTDDLRHPQNLRAANAQSICQARGYETLVNFEWRDIGPDLQSIQFVSIHQNPNAYDVRTFPVSDETDRIIGNELEPSFITEKFTSVMCTNSLANPLPSFTLVATEMMAETDMGVEPPFGDIHEIAPLPAPRHSWTDSMRGAFGRFWQRFRR